jgi:hypothetical protein
VQTAIKRPLGRQGLGFSGVVVPSGERAATAVSSGVRTTAIPRASGCGAPRRAIGGTLLWLTGKHRRCSRTGRAAAAAVSSGVRAVTTPGASDYGAPRRATGGDAPMVGGQAPTALPNRTSGSDIP